MQEHFRNVIEKFSFFIFFGFSKFFENKLRKFCAITVWFFAGSLLRKREIQCENDMGESECLFS